MNNVTPQETLAIKIFRKPMLQRLNQLNKYYYISRAKVLPNTAKVTLARPWIHNIAGAFSIKFLKNCFPVPSRLR